VSDLFQANALAFVAIAIILMKFVFRLNNHVGVCAQYPKMSNASPYEVRISS